MEGWRGVLRGILEGEWLAAPRKKVFTAKFELPELRSYKGVNREVGEAGDVEGGGPGEAHT